MDRLSDTTKPFCTTAYFVDNYAIFTCGNGDGPVVASAFYHASSGASHVASGSQQHAVEPSGGSSSQNNGANDSPPAPAGPIAGGVVGGCVVIVVPIVIWLVLREKRKRKQDASSDLMSGSMTELQKPPETAQSQNVNELGSSQYVEMEAPPTELALGKAQYSHELSYAPAKPTSLGRSELYAGETAVQRSELDGNSSRDG